MKYFLQQRIFKDKNCDVFYENKKKMYSFLCLVIFILSLIFLLWRAKFGFCFNDEPFTFTLAQRLYNGDRLLVDEWHGQQNFGVILLPLYYLYQTFFMSNEGLLLFSRYIYCFVWFGVCLIVFKTLKEYTFAALIGFIYLVLFSPLDYMTLSYTSISLMCTLLICCMLYYYFKLDDPFDNSFSNIMYSLVLSLLIIIDVLCCPYLAFVYIIITVFILVLYFSKRHFESKVRNIVTIWTFVTIFVAVIGILYLYVFVFSKSSIITVFENLKYILMSPDLKKISIIDTLVEIFTLIYLRSKYFSILIGIVTLFCVFSKKVKMYRIQIFSFCSIIWLFTQSTIFFFIDNHEFNIQMLFIVLLGLVAFLLLKEKPWKLFYIFYGMGAIFTYFTSMKTLTGLYSISMTFSISGIAAIIFIVLLGKEMIIEFSKIKFTKSLITMFTILLLFFQIYSEGYVRILRTYSDGYLNELTSQISFGAAKGLVTTTYTKENYERQVKELNYLLSKTDTINKKLLIYTFAPYLYLDANLNFSTFSSWTYGFDEALNQRFESYYKTHTNKIPDLIYITDIELNQKITYPETYERLNYGKSVLLIKN